MFLVPTLPHDASRIGTYCGALLAAFDSATFERFYAEALGRILEHEVDTEGGFEDVLFRLLLKSQHDGTLRELLVAILCYRAGNTKLVDVLVDVLAVQPIVKLATTLSERQYPPALGHEAVDTLYAGRHVRKRRWIHHEGRAAWIEALVVCDNLPSAGEPVPPLIACLNTIDRTWRPPHGVTAVREQIDEICMRYGIPLPPDRAASTTTPGAADSQPALPQARVVDRPATRADGDAGPQRLRSVLRSGWRAATSDGQGAYQLAMICFGLAAFLFHDSLQPQKREQEYLKRNLGRQQEPLRAQRYPVLDGLLLPSTSSRSAAADNPHQLCNEDLIRELDTAYQIFRREYTKYSKQQAPDPCPHKLIKTRQGKTTGLGGSWTDSDAATTLLIPSSLAYSWERRAAPEPSAPPPAARPPAAQPTPRPAGPAVRPGAKPPGAPAGSRAATPRNRGAPAAPPRPPDPCTGEDAASQLRCAFRGPIEGSRAISALAGFLQKKQPGSGLPRISSFYFISPEGIQRSIPRFDPELLPAHRVFNAESYVYRALSRDGGIFSEAGPEGCKQIGVGELQRTGTHPYFDLLGSGLQETACYPVDIGTAAAPEIVGVLCADVAVPFDVVLSGLEAASQAFEISLMKLSNGGKIVQSCRDFPRPSFWDRANRALTTSWETAPIDEVPCSPALSRLDEDKSKALAKEYYMARFSTPKPDPFGLGGVTPIRGDHYFGVVVAAANPQQGPWYIAVGKPRTTRTRNYTSLTLCAFNLLAGVSVLVLGFRRKLKRQQALLARGLPYGLLELAEGKIIGANDRAEEILLRPLPRLGIHSCKALSMQTLSGMLEEERCVLVPASGQLREHDIRTYDFTIRDRTSDGLTSTFYAWVKLRRSWIKITSTVILMPDTSEHVFCALDTNIEEAHRLFLANVRQGDQ